MRPTLRTSLLTLTTMLLLITACAADDDDDTDPDDTGEVTQEEEVDEDADPAEDDDVAEDDADDSDQASDGTEPPQPEDAPDDGGEAGLDAASDTGADLLDGLSFEPTPQRIEYRFDLPQPEAPEAMIVARDEGRLATWITVQDMEVATFIDADGALTSCLDDGTGWICFDQPMDDQMPGGVELPSFGDLTAPASGLPENLREVSEARIAGRDAVCGQTRGVAGEADNEGEICLDAATGSVLRLDIRSGSSEGTFLEAVDVTEATEEDLSPPADAQRL